MPARLAVHLAQSPMRVWHLEDDRDYVVGRAPDVDVQIPDDRVSQRHLLLTGHGGEWTARDLGSKNGTLLDGRPLTGSTEIGGASWLGIGGVMADFRPVSVQAVTGEIEGIVARWQSSAALQRLLEPGLGIDALLARFLDSVLQLSRAERGFVLLRRDDGEMEIRARRGLEVDELRQESFSGSAAAVDRALAEHTVVVVSDVSADSELAARPSIVGGDIRALVSIPLRVGDDLLGAIYADSRSPGAVITQLDVEILEALSRQAALALRLARLDSDLESLLSRLSTRLADDPELAAWVGREIEGLGGDTGWSKGGEETPSTPPPSPPETDTWGGITAVHTGAS